MNKGQNVIFLIKLKYFSIFQSCPWIMIIITNLMNYLQLMQSIKNKKKIESQTNIQKDWKFKFGQ